MGIAGAKLIERRLARVIERAWRSGFSTKSDYARQNADYIAIAAQQRLLTTRTTDGMYGRSWYATPKGLTLLWRHRKDTTE